MPQSNSISEPVSIHQFATVVFVDFVQEVPGLGTRNFEVVPEIRAGGYQSLGGQVGEQPEQNTLSPAPPSTLFAKPGSIIHPLRENPGRGNHAIMPYSHLPRVRLIDHPTPLAHSGVIRPVIPI
jgi:hypothetical protein